MFRCFLSFTPSRSHRKLPHRSNPALTTSAAASPAVSSPPRASLFFQSQNPTRHLIPFKSLADQYTSSEPQIKTQDLDHASNGAYGYLATRFRDSRTSNDAQNFHLQICKLGFAKDLFLCNTLINVYVRIGALVEAGMLFEEMPDKNSVTWACLISGYTQNGMPNVACANFKRMVSGGFSQSPYAFGSVLRACQESGPSKLKFGMQTHGLISKTDHASDMVMANVLMSMYGKCLGPVDDAYRVFCEIKIRNSISWNSIISVYCQRGDAVSAYKLFSSMQKDGVGFSLKPNEYTFGSLITAACSLADSGLSLLQQMLTRIKKSGILQDLYVGSALVSGFARFGLIDYARNIFEQMSQRNAVSMNGLMVALVRQKQGEKATEVFMEMKDLVGTNLDSLVVLLSSFPEFLVLEEGKRRGREVHAYVIGAGLIYRKVAIGNGLVNMYAKCGAINDACSVFRHMVDKDLISWNSLISGLDQNERFEEAVMNVLDMRRSELMPSNFTLISALSSCASLGWIMLGQQIHCEALTLGLDFDVSVSNALLALYSDTGYLSECRNVFFLMPEYDQVSWNSIIGA